MQLFYSNTSPYARKVRLVIIEKGLGERVQSVACNPFQDLPALSRANPLRKVPTLLTDEGFALYDSPVICEYLDYQHDEPRLIPESGRARWDVRRREAMADGLMDASYNMIMERNRATLQQSPEWIGHWQGEVERVVQQAEHEMNTTPSMTDLASLALAAALGYLDFRLPDIPWRGNCPGLREWYEEFALRPAMQETRPVPA